MADEKTVGETLKEENEKLQKKVASMEKTIDELNKTIAEMDNTNKQIALAYNETTIIKNALITQIRLLSQNK